MSLTTIILLSFTALLVVGFVSILQLVHHLVRLLNFAYEWREKFIQLSNEYNQSYDAFDRPGYLNEELYTWLTKNVNEIQANLGRHGVIYYRAPMGLMTVSNYQVLLNTLPKFAQHKIEDFDVKTCHDCLLRYTGSMEKLEKKTRRQLYNPVICFKEGVQQLFSLPVYVLHWFGLLNDRAVRKVTGNILFRWLSGVGSLITCISGIVTIIQGKQETIAFLTRLFSRSP